MRIVSADWIFTGEGPALGDAAVLLHGSEVLRVGPRAEVEASVDAAEKVTLPRSLLLPGLVNAHTHLELGGMERLPATNGFSGWVRELLKRREARSEEEMLRGAEDTVLVMKAMGTAHVADTASSLETLFPLLRVNLENTVFFEFLGLGPEAHRSFEKFLSIFEEGAKEGERIFPSCHAPFSTSAELFRTVGEWARSNKRPTSVHLAESGEEERLFHHGDGPLVPFLRERGMEESWIPRPGMSPVAYLDHLGFLHENTLAVHLVEVGEEEIRLLAERGVTPCLCPTSNLHLAGRLPPVKEMLEAGLSPCLGTDSTASGESPILFREMEVLLDAGVEVEQVMRMATASGADALGLEPGAGRITPGAHASILRLPLDGGGPPLEQAVRNGAKGWVQWVLSPEGIFDPLDGGEEPPDPGLPEKGKEDPGT